LSLVFFLVFFVLYSFILIILSISIIWSEVTFQLSDSNISLFYIYLKYSRFVSYIFFELVIVVLLIYMCLCTYTSLFKLQLFQYYHLFPHHHTDDNSLVFCAAYLCRLIFPLCYNFLNLTDNSQTAFSKIMGKMDLVPLLGKEFNGYVPIMMVIFTFITFFNIHGKLLKYFGIDSHFGIDHFSITNDNDQDEIQDGKYLIEQARHSQERNHNSNLNFKYESINYSNFNLRNSVNKSSTTNKNNNNNNNNNKDNNNNNSNQYDKPNTYRQDSNDSTNTNNNQNSAFDYPFHFKSQNQNYPYAAPSSTEYNQRFGSSYSPSNGSTIYSPSVGGGHSSNATINPQTFYSLSGTSASKTNPTPSYHHTSVFNVFHPSSKSKNSNNNNNKNKSKKKFGFNINTNINDFYNNYPSLLAGGNNGNGSSSNDNRITGINPLKISSPTSTGGATTSSSRKFGYNPNTGINGPRLTPTFSTSPSTIPNSKSKTRMFGVNYTLNG